VFDLSIGKLLVLAVIAIVVFGPEQLPKVAAQAGRTLRDLRRLAEGATNDLREGLGPEFSDFDVTDLNPRNFVRKHLMDDLLSDDPQVSTAAASTAAATATVAAEPPAGGTLAPEESPPYDSEAT
jgi:sec-independent protein translocase protein TatB